MFYQLIVCFCVPLKILNKSSNKLKILVKADLCAKPLIFSKEYKTLVK